MFMWGWGAMNPTAVKEAAKIGYPMDHLIGIWWAGGEDDARPAGAGGQGLSARSTSTASAPTIPAIQDILKYVIDKGKSQIARRIKVGENLLQSRRLNSVIIAEAIRNAQKITGKKVVTGEDVRRGLENLNITGGALEGTGPGPVSQRRPCDLRRP